MVFNATFNNIAVISWQSVLLVEETRVTRNQNASRLICHNTIAMFKKLMLNL